MIRSGRGLLGGGTARLYARREGVGAARVRKAYPFRYGWRSATAITKRCWGSGRARDESGAHATSPSACTVEGAMIWPRNSGIRLVLNVLIGVAVWNLATWLLGLGPTLDIPLNCPQCGCRMEPPPDFVPRDDGIVVVECPLHGLFHFGLDRDLAVGPPPQTETLAIAQSRMRWLGALEAGDLDGYLQAMSPNVVWVPPRGDALHGHADLKSWLGEFGDSVAHSGRQVGACRGPGLRPRSPAARPRAGTLEWLRTGPT